MVKIAKPHISSKHLKIQKANLRIVISVSVAVFVTVFCLFAGRDLLAQSSYQQRVINEKNKALDIAKRNSENVKDLEASYVSFATEPINVIGGNPDGTGEKDGSNPKIVLDSLPSEYDYPALSSSIEKLLVENNYTIERIGGSEDAALSSDNDDDSSQPTATIVEIPYNLSIASTAEGTKNLLDIFERSIRPFYIEKIELSGSETNMTARISMKTYYQTPTSFNVTSKGIK